MTPMIDMELSDDAKGDYGSIVAPAGISAPQYPPGLMICLDQDILAKLGVDPEDAVKGGYFTIHAICCVTSVSHTESDAGICDRVEAQIEKMAVDLNEDEPADAAPAPKKSGRLYSRPMT